MRDRSLLGALLLIGLVMPLTSCTSSPSLTSISVTPDNINFGGPGLTTQLRAIGSYTHPGHPAITKDITSQVTWTSASVDCVTVSNTGLITSQNDSCSNIPVTASMTGFNGDITASMTVSVAISTGGGGGNSDVTSLSIIPPSQAVASPNQTAQFIAIGSTASGATVNVTTLSAWSSSSPSIATIGANTGLATGVNQGSATITAIFSNVDGSVATGTATFTVVGGASEPFTALTVLPGSLTLSATGQTGQLIALATSGSTGLTEDVTNSPNLTWTSTVSSIASVSTYPTAPAGLVTGVGPGSTTVTAKLTNPDNTVLTNTSTVTVSSTATSEPLQSIVVLPSSITVNNLLGTGQFLAYGTFSTPPTVMDITNGINHNGFVAPVTWVSTAPDIFPINSAGAPGSTGGLVTAVGSGIDDVYAVAANPDGTVVYSPGVSFNCPYVAYVPATATSQAVLGSCNEETIANGLLVTLTVFNAGLNTSGWELTAPSATGTPDVIHCGPGSTSGGSVCTATYPIGTTVTITAPAEPGVNFGGWSYNCVPTGPVTAAGPNACTIDLGTAGSSNESVGAIFN